MSSSVYAPLWNRPEVFCHSWGRNLASRVRRVQQEAFELQLPTLGISPYLERQISVRFVGIGRSTKPTSGLKFGPVFLRSTILRPVRAARSARRNIAASTRLPGDCVPAMCASTNQSLEKNKVLYPQPPVWLKLSSTSPIVCRFHDPM